MMKLFRKISALVMVMALLLSLSISAWAVDYNAANADDLLNAFWDESGEDVNINLTDNVDADHWFLTGQEGIKYTIDSEDGKTLSNAFFGGTTDLTVNTDIDGEIGVGDQANVTVNGDVGDYVGAWGDATLEINGDVAGYVGSSENANITVNGNVGDGASAWNNSSINISGDVDGYVNAGENGEIVIGGDVSGSVSAYDNTSVDIAGDVTNEEDWTAVSADHNATVNVGGNVTSNTEGIYAWSDSSISVGGNVVAGDNIDTGDPTFTYGGSAVNASGNATVTVGGDAIGGNAEGEGMVIGGYGVSAWTDGEGAPTITVGGDAIGGNGVSTSEEPFSAQGGYGVSMPGSANVTVGGDAIGGDGEGIQSVAGAGVSIGCEPGGSAGSLTIKGTVAQGEGEYSMGDLSVQAWINPDSEDQTPGEAPEISVGYAEEIFVGGFGEEEDAELLAKLEAQIKPKLDTFWNDTMAKINAAQPGDEITVNVYNRMSISALVINAARDKEVTLIIQWDGGDDLVIDKNFTAEINGTILLKDLAELLKK